MKKEFSLIRRNIHNTGDGRAFEVLLGAQTELGFNVEACGMSGNSEQAWAILSKPAEEVPKQINLVEAVKEIAWMCRNRDDCTGCPLSRKGKCLASEGRDKGVPGWWAITEGQK